MWHIAFVLLTLTALTSATEVNQCSGGNIENLQEHVTIGKCVSPPCRLKKNTSPQLKIKFIAEYAYKNLTQNVSAKIVGIGFPFIGIDGTSPCPNIFEEDEKTPNKCNFEKGKTYVYKNSFEILQIYPRVKIVVHWAITDQTTGKHAFCFDVPAVITN